MPLTIPSETSVKEHYTRPNLAEAILAGLAAFGKDLDHLAPEDLAPVDEFHIRGRQATLELAPRLGLLPGQEVLDVGSGIGGASRYLATRFGCQVTGLDLSDEYCQVARMLASRTGLDRQVRYQQGSALEMPFADHSFDVVWTQHAAMNIGDKFRLYREIARVLRPGGTFAMYDALAGPGGPLILPVPWARQAEISFLISPASLRERLQAEGLELTWWRDTSQAGLDWFAEMAARPGQTDNNPNRAVGLHMLMGPDFRLMAQNMITNLKENRVLLAECLAKKPALA